MTDRALKLLLVASLAANVFLVGGAVGAVAIWGVRKAEAPPQAVARPASALGRRPLRFAADELGPPQRQAFRAALRQAWREAAPQTREGRAQRQRLVRLLGDPSPDRAAIADAMSRARQADLAARARVEDAVADFATGLSPTDRSIFVAGLRRSNTLRATENPPPTR